MTGEWPALLAEGALQELEEGRRGGGMHLLVAPFSGQDLNFGTQIFPVSLKVYSI